MQVSTWGKLQVRIPCHELYELRSLAKEWGMSVSLIVRQLVAGYLREVERNRLQLENKRLLDYAVNVQANTRDE